MGYEIILAGQAVPTTLAAARVLGVGIPVSPVIVFREGPAAQYAWDEFFGARVRNPATRKTYAAAVRRFLAWAEAHSLALNLITPGAIGAYLDQFPGSIPTKKVHLAALRALFDWLCQRHVLVLNPAASVRGERYQVIEGKTPEIVPDQARLLLRSISVGTLVGLRDRAIVAVLIYTAARAGAVARLRRTDLVHDGVQYSLRFDEKGGKQREIPVRSDLERYLTIYLEAANFPDVPSDGPLFRSADGSTDQLTDRPISGADICRLVKRLSRQAGISTRFSPHSFRVGTVTDLLTQGVPLEDVQYLAGHSDSRTTALYDRRRKQVSRNIVERISV